MRGPGRLSSVAPGALVVAGVGILVMVAASGGYGYHRDELYFLRAGRHLAWGYPDQPPLTPLLARLMDELAPGSLVVLRLPSALAYGGVILLTSLIAHRTSAGRRPQGADARRDVRRSRHAVRGDRAPAEHDDVRPAALGRADAARHRPVPGC